MVVFRTSTIENLTGLFGLAHGMRAAARMIQEADEVMLDHPHETAEFVARTLGKPIIGRADDDPLEAENSTGQTPSWR